MNVSSAQVLSLAIEMALPPPAPPLALDEAIGAPDPVEPTVIAVPTVVAAPTVVAVEPTVIAVPAQPTYAQRGEAALRRIPFQLSSIGYTISFHPGNGSYRGLTFTRRRHIEIYVRPSMTDGHLAYVIGHEIGHAVDHILNDLSDRSRWRAARGMAPSLAWWPTNIASDLATPAGDFAECFASWATGSASHSSWGSCAAVSGLMSELVRG